MSERSIGREEPQARQGCSGNIQLSLIFDFVGIIADPVQEVLLSERNVRIWFGVFDACYEFKSARLPISVSRPIEVLDDVREVRKFRGSTQRQSSFGRDLGRRII